MRWALPWLHEGHGGYGPARGCTAPSCRAVADAVTSEDEDQLRSALETARAALSRYRVPREARKLVGEALHECREAELVKLGVMLGKKRRERAACVVAY